MKKLTSIGFVIVILIYGCSQNKFTTFQLSHLRDTSFYFQSDLLHPTLLEISINGYSDDSFLVNNIRLGGGNIDTVLKIDWYRDTVAINLKRYKAITGRLTFNCRTY
ncbi:hypothetical protein [Hydrotalea flava]|uniref:hypothetical protein n=1 Tax=Hydrotalea flava TaxID=714549 RepID=UPI00142ED718|nr:hypothetical protein [Hydrotalea flava]